MPEKEIRKSAREVIKVTPSEFKGYDLINVRIYAKVAGQSDPIATKKGIAIPVDLAPALIDALTWAVGQPCDQPPEAPERKLPKQDADVLAQLAWEKLKKHGSAVHWDAAERIVLSNASDQYSKWDLHFVLATRSDLFQRLEDGCYKAKAILASTNDK